MSANTKEHREVTRKLFYALLVLFAMLPVPLGGSIDWFWMLATAFTYLLMAIWLLNYSTGRVRLTDAFIRARPVLYLFAIWLAWNLLQMLPIPINWLQSIAPLSAQSWQQAIPDIMTASITIDSYATREELIKGSAYALIFALILLLVDSPGRVRVLGLWLIAVSVIVALVASVMALTGNQFIYTDSFVHRNFPYYSTMAHGTFMNPNQLAAYLVMNISLGIGLLLSTMKEGGSHSWREWFRNMAMTLLSRKIRLRIYLAILVITLVLTRSRMGNVSFFLSLFLAGGLSLALMRKSPRPVVILLTSLLIIDLMILGSWFGMDRLQEKFKLLETETVAMDTRTNTVTRIDTNLYGFEIYKDAPLTGTGAGSFYAIYPSYEGWSGVPMFIQHAHNDYLEFLTDTGWIGILMLGAIVTMSFFAALRALRTRRHPLMRGMAFTAVMGILYVILHSAADFFLRVPANAALFMVILAMGWISLAMKVERRE